MTMTKRTVKTKVKRTMTTTTSKPCPGNHAVRCCYVPPTSPMEVAVGLHERRPKAWPLACGAITAWLALGKVLQCQLAIGRCWGHR